MFVLERLESHILSGGPNVWTKIFEAKKRDEIREFLRTKVSNYAPGNLRLLTITKNGATAVTYQPPM